MKKILYMSWIFFILITGCGLQDEQAELETFPEEWEDIEDMEMKEIEEIEEIEETKIMVYICGAIANEGVYTLQAGSRLFEVIEMAGGMSEEAATTYLNQAELLVDGQRIYVPTNEELEKQGDASIGMIDGKESGLININHATKEELMTLSGIGDSKAQSIIDYREEQGGFQSIEDIQNIPGIKEGVFNKIKDLICV